MAYRLIAFDMDGTMLDEKKELPEKNMQAIKAAAEKGCFIVPATGRMVGGMPKEIRELPFVRYYITMNGALVWDEQEKKSIYSSEMDCEEVLRLFRYLDDLPVGYDCYHKGQGYISEEMFSQIEQYFEKIPRMINYVKNIRTKVPELKAAIAAWNEPIQKIQIYFRAADENLRQELLEKLPGLFPEMVFTTSLANNIEVNSRGAGKDKGLEALCAHLGLDMAESVAFGDGSNDCGLLRVAGLGVCMANGCEQAKAAADMITVSNDEAGVGFVIEELISAGKI